MQRVVAGKKVWSDSEMLQALRDYYEEHRELPTRADIDSVKDAPRANTFVRRFGSMRNAMIAAGIIGDEDNDEVDPDFLRVRPEVKMYAYEIERVLSEHDEVKGERWKNRPIGEVYEQLGRTMDKFRKSQYVGSDEKVEDKLIDIGASAMMLLHRLRERR